MKKILCYCEFDARTGFGHFSRIKVILDILNLKNVDILTENFSAANKFFRNQNVIRCKNIFVYLRENFSKYKFLIIDPPYYPNQEKQQIKFSKRFRSIYELKNKKFKVLWLTDEERPSEKFCDLLINDYPNSSKFKNFYKKKNKKIKTILGIYAFLYSKEILQSRYRFRKKHIFISFGGDDPKNLILKYFSVLRNLEGKKFFIVNSKTYKILGKFNNKKNLIFEKKNQCINMLLHSLILNIILPILPILCLKQWP